MLDADDLKTPAGLARDAGVTTGAGVASSRSIATTAPLAGGGDLSADRTLTVSAATTSAAGSMSAADKTKLDGILSSATPQPVGTAAAGSGTSAAKDDHVHAHGSQSDGTMHAAAIAGGASGFMTGAQATLLALIKSGTGSPEGAVTGPVGTLYLRTDGGTDTTLYVKETGSGNTGWAAK